MDERRFDRIVKELSTGRTRRGVLRLFFSLPLVATFATALGGADARRRKRRRKRKRKGRKCRPESLAETCAGRCGTVRNNCRQAADCGPCDCDPPCATCQTCDGTQCQECAVCCADVCCAEAGALCHEETGACCVPEPQEVTCDGRCGLVANNCGIEVPCGSCQPCAGCPACNCDDRTGQCRPAPIVGKPCGDGLVCQANGSCSCTSTSCGACRRCEAGVCRPCARCTGGACDR